MLNRTNPLLFGSLRRTGAWIDAKISSQRVGSIFSSISTSVPEVFKLSPINAAIVKSFAREAKEKPSLLSFLFKGLPTSTFPAKKTQGHPSINDQLTQRIKPLISEIYDKVRQGDIEGANQFAQRKLLTRVDIATAIEIGNELLRHDKAFRDFIQECINHYIQSVTPHIKYDFISPDHKPVAAFRSVVINGKYGDPKYTTDFTALLFNQLLSGGRTVIAPTINTFAAKETDKGEFETTLLTPERYDKLGFTFGPLISMTLNLFHALDERYTFESERGKNAGKRVIYLLAITKGYNIGHAIHENAGYIRDQEKGRRGEKGTGNTEDAAEIAGGPYIEEREILGYRLVDKDNNLEPFVRSEKASEELLEELRKKDAHVEIFLTAKNLKYTQALEAALVADPIKIPGYPKKYVELMGKNKELTKRIRADARGHARDELLRLQVHDHREAITDTHCMDTKEHWDILHFAEEQKKRIEKGELDISHQRFFHSVKAKSEAELKERAIQARMQLAGQTGKMSGLLRQTEAKSTHKKSNKK